MSEAEDDSKKVKKIRIRLNFSLSRDLPLEEVNLLQRESEETNSRWIATARK